MTLKDNVLYDGSNEEYIRFSLLENTTAEDYLKSLSDENAQYNEVETLNGKKTESGGSVYRASCIYTSASADNTMDFRSGKWSY